MPDPGHMARAGNTPFLHAHVRVPAPALYHSHVVLLCSHTLRYWMQWQLLAARRPVLVQQLLYRLGYVERADSGVREVPVHVNDAPGGGPAAAAAAARGAIHVAVLGGPFVGKVRVRACLRVCLVASAFICSRQ